MANMVTITEARFCELLKREETLDAYRKAYGEMQKERDELKERLKKSHDACAHCMDDGRLAAAERCIDDIQKELSKAEAGNSIGNVKAAMKIIRAHSKAKEAKEAK